MPQIAWESLFVMLNWCIIGKLYLFSMEFARHPDRFLRHFISAPFIYVCIVPAVFLDLVVELYHRVCFPLYRLPYVKRTAYIRVDRQRLSYLNFLEKLNCMYCGYMNGLFHYVSAIAGASEAYWCGIMHEKKKGFIPPAHHKDFLPYGDEKAYREFVEKKRP